MVITNCLKSYKPIGVRFWVKVVSQYVVSPHVVSSPYKGLLSVLILNLHKPKILVID